MPLESGDRPDPVTAPNQDGERVTVSFEDPTVLFFYPEDGTPGCTTEAEQFGLEFDAYEDAGVAVYGVSRDGVDDHGAFHDDLDLPFDLLADPDGKIGDAFGVERMPDGRFERTTVVLADGEIQRIYEGVGAHGHARQVLGDMLDDGLVDLAT